MSGQNLASLPAPFVPAEVDLRDMDGFMLNVERLLASELWAISTGDEFKAAVGLWARAWKQVPAASLPNDDRVLASFAGMSVSRWKKSRAMAMRGFVICSDGRLYHRVLAEDAKRAWSRKESFRERGRRGNDRRWKGDHRPPQPQGGGGSGSDPDRKSDLEADGKTLPKPSQKDAPAIAQGSLSDPTAILNDRQGQGQGQGQGLNPVPNGTDEASPSDPEKALWDFALAVLGAAGIAPAKARPIIGKWRSVARDDGKLMQALMAAKKNHAQAPVEYVTKALSNELERARRPLGFVPMHPGAGG